MSLEDSAMTEALSPGRYRHYKNNNECTVIAMVRHSETEEALALYRAEYGKRELWVRPIKNFCELVDVGDSRVKRFELIAPIKSA